MYAHLNIIQEGLLGYTPPVNALSNQKMTMYQSTRKYCMIPMERFESGLTELNNYLTFLPGLEKPKNIEEEELN